jgi:hypothetical protein
MIFSSLQYRQEICREEAHKFRPERWEELIREFKTLENRDPVIEYVEQRTLTIESRNSLEGGPSKG